MTFRWRLRRNIVRATICVDTETREDVALAEAWLMRWRPRLGYLSDDLGCGCCVHMWDVDGPPEAIAELPDRIRADSAYVRGEGPTDLTLE